MRILFEIDRKDYGECTHIFRRDSARSIIIKDGKIALIHSLKYDYYKFPGGGIENNEDPVDAMIRETLEEAGLYVIKESVKEYGLVHRIQRSTIDKTNCFIQDNYYYLCDVLNEKTNPHLEEYEEDEMFQLEYVDPLFAISKNQKAKENHDKQPMIEREIKILELLKKEKLI